MPNNNESGSGDFRHRLPISGPSSDFCIQTFVSFVKREVPFEIITFPFVAALFNEYGQIFVYLLSRLNEICTYAEIIEVVWGNSKIKKNACQQAVSRLREILKNTELPYKILTIHDEGYMMQCVTEGQDQ